MGQDKHTGRVLQSSGTWDVNRFHSNEHLELIISPSIQRCTGLLYKVSHFIIKLKVLFSLLICSDEHKQQDQKQFGGGKKGFLRLIIEGRKPRQELEGTWRQKLKLPQPIHSRPKSINSSQSIQAQQTRLSFLTFTFIFNSMYTCLSVCPYFHTEVRKGQWIPWS